MNYLLFEELCKRNGTTPSALSKRLGLSKGNTTSWKNGGNPSVEVLCKIADELNCTTDCLLGRKYEYNPSVFESNNNVAYGENSSIQVNNTSVTSNISEISKEITTVLESLPLKERSKLIVMIYEFQEEYLKNNT